MLDHDPLSDQRRCGAPQPAIRVFGELTVSSDQLLELLLFARYGPDAMRMLLSLFGAVEPIPNDRLLAAYKGEEPLRPALLPAEGEDESIGDFKRFSLSLLVGARWGWPSRSLRKHGRTRPQQRRRRSSGATRVGQMANLSKPWAGHGSQRSGRSSR